ncbi:MAG: two-component sensor histidine kinase [Gemmatimonadales bacterium]|nr:two-component sensor histidine kinase [Gemmatimonadales bacterium]
MPPPSSKRCGGSATDSARSTSSALERTRSVRLANRFFLAAAAVLVVAYAAARFSLRLDGTGVGVEFAVLGGILLLLWPAARLVARKTDRELGEAREAVDRIRDRVKVSERESGDLRVLFDRLDDGLAFIDREGLVSLCNPAFERWAGRDVAPGARVGTLFRSPGIAEAVSAAQGGESTTAEVELGEHTVLMSTRPHRSGAIIVLHDLTVLRRLEGVRRDFVANVSHELKTPLTSVVGFAEALVEGGIDADQAGGFARRILFNATRMRYLVDDLLDLSLLESGSWSPEPETVSVGAIAREAWETLSPKVRADDLELRVSGTGEFAWADPDAVRQVMRNLLDNAARYSDEDPAISVRVASDGRFQRVEVSDRGPGIASVHVERVFERFYRVDPARSRARGGTGLGLAIVKHFVEAHGGEIGIESALGRGTTVWFTLPDAARRPDRESVDVPA